MSNFGKIKTQVGKVFTDNVQDILKLYSAGNHEAIFEVLTDKGFVGQRPISKEMIDKGDICLRKISKRVNYGDLRNLDDDAELKDLFDRFTAQTYENLGERKAELYLNSDVSFRNILKKIRRGKLFFDEAKLFLRTVKHTGQD